MVYNGKRYEQMDDLGVPLFLETPIYMYIYIYTHTFLNPPLNFYGEMIQFDEHIFLNGLKGTPLRHVLPFGKRNFWDFLSWSGGYKKSVWILEFEFLYGDFAQELLFKGSFWEPFQNAHHLGAILYTRWKS